MQFDSQQFYLGIFEGPLDLLLYLIRKDEVDIYDIPIKGITEQYLKYLDLLKMLDLDIAGEFLAMAATLMQIKSRLLLPPEERPEEEEEEDPRWELVKKLLEYRRFKSAADDFYKLEVEQEKYFARGGEKLEIVPPSPLPLMQVDVFQLLDAFSEVLTESEKRMPVEMEADSFSLEDGQKRVLSRIERNNSVVFSSLFNRKESRSRIVIIFLAILELIRQKIIRVIQEDHFGKIMIEKVKAE
jgi:segregation and condensation protein A